MSDETIGTGLAHGSGVVVYQTVQIVPLRGMYFLYLARFARPQKPT